MKKIFILIICTISSLFALDVTFRVDISNVDSDPSCAPTVAGSFNNWSYAHTMVDMGNDLWEQTLSLDSNSLYEFKFGICSWQLEDLAPGGDCTITTFGFTNRYISTYSDDIVLDTYFYSTCDISTNSGGEDGGGDDGGGEGGEWTLVWSDEFNSPYINATKWSYDVGTGSWGWGNGEAQYYTDNSNNSYIQDGKLIIKAIKESYGGADYTSARLVTKNKGDWKYGRMEIRAKMPTGVGTWPAIWLLPTDYVYGGWPNSGEIDIMEAVGYDHGVVHATCHTDVYNWFDGIPPPGGEIDVEDFDVEFHDYVLEWTENSLKWYLDGVNYYTFTNNNQGWSHWPFDQEFHLLLNIAIGGTWGGQQGIDDSIFPVQMEVEYVRVYQGGDSGGGSDDAEVTFMVDMRNEDVSETGVFVSGDSPLAGPAGVLMSDSDNDNIWTLTLSMPPGTYNYKFRNGYYDFWDGPGWESSNNLDECGYGEWNDRQIIVGTEDITLEPFCFGSCLICEGYENCDLIGDLNSDSSLDILDIVILVNLILNETEGNICSDFNQDGMINILDIVSLVSEIL